MIVTLYAETENDPKVRAVVDLAAKLGVKPEVKSTEGDQVDIVQVLLVDGKVKSCTLPEHAFHNMPGVQSVQRVTPSAVALTMNGYAIPKHIVIGDIAVGNDLPCQLIAGPCTVDKNIERIVGELYEKHGVSAIRGGCWKPRSNPHSFPGFGKRAVEWLLRAATKYAVPAILLEVIDETHVADVMAIQDAVGYTGTIVLWVGARTENQILFRKLGRQDRYPVMFKNPIRMQRISEWTLKAEFVITGERHFDDNAELITDQSLDSGNDQILMLSRGVEQTDPDSQYRFIPRHEVIDAIRSKLWTPVGVDPSHSAGTMVDDLVFTNLRSALAHKPAFAMVETYLTDEMGLCDQQQAVPHNRIHELRAMIAEHNAAHYAIAV